MQIERIKTMPAKALENLDFSFEIEFEAVGPFNGPGLTNVIAVTPRRKEYGVSTELFEHASASERLLVVAREADKIAGYLLASRGWNNCTFIEDIAVERTFRRCGIGKMLMDEAVGWATQLRVPTVRLETQSTNVPACRFYERYGFVLGGYDQYLYRQLDEDVRNEVALFWYLFAHD